MLKDGAAAPKVMLIEDDKDIVSLIRYNLEKTGFEVIQANDGEEGLAAIKTNTPDLIILDLMLPKIDGYGFLDTVKNDPLLTRIPVIILSAKVTPGAIIKGFRLGAIDYVPKPFNVGELVLKVRSILEAEKGKDGDKKEEVRLIHGG